MLSRGFKAHPYKLLLIVIVPPFWYIVCWLNNFFVSLMYIDLSYRYVYIYFGIIMYFPLKRGSKAKFSFVMHSFSN